MPSEVERKWLVEQAPPEVLASPAEEIHQGYLAIGADGAEARIRRRGERCSLTAKAGTGLVRSEHEVEITFEQFESLWPATEGVRVTKRRHILPAQDGHTIELDVYGGALSGLIVAEVEFDDPWGAESFVAPYWFGPEVTADAAYKNQSLALRGRPAAPASP
jgi:CYTH domain-containing protein